MLIKSIDDREAELVELERASGVLTGDKGKRAALELKQRKSGLKGERDAAYLVDFHNAASKHRAVIHDLRLEHQGRVAQIDHLVLTRWMEWYVLESKHFHAGVKITEEGEFLRWNNFNKSYEGMESPIEQNERHIAVLKDVVRTLDLPVRLGLRVMPTFRSYVLISSKSRIDRPKKFDTSRIIKADQIKTSMLNDIDNESTLTSVMSVAKLVSPETVRGLAEQLVAQHRPMKWSLPGWLAAPGPASRAKVQRAIVAAAPPAAPTSDSRPQCKKCGGSEGLVLHKYGYYFKCLACGGNTAIRFTCKPDNKPALRKEGNNFFRECPECGTSSHYFANHGS